MKLLSATYAALTAAVIAVVVALPAAASTPSYSGTGGSSPTLSDGGQSTTSSSSSQQASAASYRPARATWYGPGFWGHRTACGATLTHATVGVAHKKLPCGTKVALRFHGRTVVARVIDRGPYSRGIDYDLTQATARKLGMSATSRIGAAPLGR